MYNLLSLSQPFATAVVKGLLNVVRTELHLEKAQRIFIYAGEPVTNPAMPIEWRQEVINHQLYGNLAETKDLPTYEPVGFVDVLCPAEHKSNVWTLGQPGTAYLVGNAHAFDTLYIGCEKFPYRDTFSLNSGGVL